MVTILLESGINGTQDWWERVCTKSRARERKLVLPFIEMNICTHVRLSSVKYWWNYTLLEDGEYSTRHPICFLKIEVSLFLRHRIPTLRSALKATVFTWYLSFYSMAIISRILTVADSTMNAPGRHLDSLYCRRCSLSAIYLSWMLFVLA